MSAALWVVALVAGFAGGFTGHVLIEWLLLRRRRDEYPWELTKLDGSGTLQITAGYGAEWVEQVAAEQGYEITRRPV